MTNQPFLFHKTVVLRSPLSPIKHAFSEQEIKEKIQTELIQEALFLSSPSLYRQIRPYLEGKLNNRDSERFLISIYKYLTRCANRCTPFGLFAGLGTIKWGDKTKITVENNAIRRFTKLDMDFICSLVEHIEEHLKEHLTFSLNSSINLQEGYFTYIEYSYSNNKRAHSVSSVELTDIISKVLQLATPGINYEELISRLSLEYKNTVSKTEINDFITSLINNQILKSDLQPRVSGDNFYEYIIARLDCIGSKTEGTNNYLELLKGRLKTIKTYLGELDSNPSLHIPSIYSKIFQNLDQLEIEYDEKKIFHVDCNHLYAPSSTLSTDLKDNIIDCLHVLNKLSRPNHNANLDQFIDAFDEKYGRRSVKLLDCLDTERGIGYPIQNSSLPPTFIADILPNANGHSRSFANREVLLTAYELKLIEAVQAWQLSSENAIDLANIVETRSSSDDEINNELPSTFSILINLLGDASRNSMLHLKSITNRSGSNYLGRFGYLDSNIHDLLENISEFENNGLAPDEILAEIVHLPDDRVGNVLGRSSFRAYEIPYLAQPSVKQNKVIQLRDIQVFVKKESREIILWSKSLNKRIRPIISNAHNYTNSKHAVYRFLCEVGLGTKFKNLNFHWGSVLSIYKQLPRVVYQNIIVSRAMWQFSGKELAAILSNKNSQTIADWRNRWRIPKLILLASGDNELLVNLEDTLSRKVLQNEVKNKHTVRLYEYLEKGRNYPITDQTSENSYANEILITVLNNKKRSTSSDFERWETSDDSLVKPQEKFLVGDDWLYYKIYCGIEYADSILCEISDLATKLIDQGVVKRWFFIRYSDPKFHVRVRFEIDQDNSSIGVISKSLNERIFSPGLKTGYISRILLDTYVRELERYGDHSIEISEKVFHTDSKMATNIFNQIKSTGLEDQRWKFGFVIVHYYLTTFLENEEQYHQFTKQCKEQFSIEFGLKRNKRLKSELDKKCRLYRKDLDRLLNSGNQDLKIETSAFVMFKRSLSECNDTLSTLVKLERKQRLLQSYVHMSLNRLFRSHQRFAEFTIYYILERHYNSSIARKKAAKKT